MIVFHFPFENLAKDFTILYKMKQFVFFVCILINQISFAQPLSLLSQIAEKEAIQHAKRFSSIQLATPANGLNIDVIQYRSHWFINPANDSIKGKVAIVFKPKSLAVSQFTVDLASNMIVSSVKFRGVNVSSSFIGESTLSINLGSQILNSGQMDSVVIFYYGRPIPSPFGSFTRQVHNGNPVISTLSEPYGAKDWWPCKQALSDKADSVDFTIYTSAPNVAVSNGLLVAFSESNGIRTYRWKHKYPITTYLIALAVTNYSQFNYKAALSSGDTLPIVNYSYPENLSEWQTGMFPIVKMIQDFDTLIGPYPFAKEKYGHAQFGFNGGMEHQTISFMGSTFLGLQAHELIHHWFGNKITCGSWNDIWLNEGFATYFGAFEYVKAGLSTWPQEGQQWIDFITTEPGGSVFCSDTTDVFRIFSSRLSYAKGAYLVRMLRHEMGDQAFWSALKNYMASPTLGYGFAKTPELVAFLEQSSGLDLSEFFKDWYKGEGYPIYEINSLINGNQVAITLNQTSSHSSVSFFEAKVPIKISGIDQDTTVFVNHSFNGQVSTFQVPFVPNSILFDPERFLLAKSNSTLVTDKVGKVLLPDLVISPNPVENYLDINGLKPGFQIQILDSKGTIKKQWFSVSVMEKVDLTSLSPGFYTISLSSAEGKTVRKLVHY